MTQTSSTSQIDHLQHCLSLAQDLARHDEASQAFEQWRSSIAHEPPATLQMIDLLWQEVLTARRSAACWREICDVEKQLSERIAENHVQLRQNYLRLVREQ